MGCRGGSSPYSDAKYAGPAPAAHRPTTTFGARQGHEPQVRKTSPEEDPVRPGTSAPRPTVFGQTNRVRKGVRHGSSEQLVGRAKLPSISELDPPSRTPTVQNLQLHTIKTGAGRSAEQLAGPLPTQQQEFGPPGQAAISLLADRYQVNSLLPRTRGPELSGPRRQDVQERRHLYDANCTWSGQLLPGRQNPKLRARYSWAGCLGPPHGNESCQASGSSGPSRLSGRVGRRRPRRKATSTSFEQEKSVKACCPTAPTTFPTGELEYYRIIQKDAVQRRFRSSPGSSETNYVRSLPSVWTQNTVFAGALHGMLNARLGTSSTAPFGGVVYAGIDTDKHKYPPIGSGRVTFNNTKSYMKAVAASFMR